MHRTTLALVLVAGMLVRASVVLWDAPWEPHHPDEHILPLEAIALWEGITPREIGWPASTTRVVLSVAAAGRWIVARGAEAWRARAEPAQVLTIITEWIGTQYVDPVSLFRMGRAVSVLTGGLELVLLAWILRGWVGPVGALIGTASVALSPIAVVHSQFVLADMAGVLFATLAMGRDQPMQGRRTVALALCAGLAATSKFHFGLWILAPIVAIWLGRGIGARRRWTLTLMAGAVLLGVLVTLIPWSWTNPLLALKEFVGVVAVKVGSRPATPGQFLVNSRRLFESEGALLWGGALLAGLFVRGGDWRRLAPIALPLGVAVLVLARSAIVFERYSLVMLPGLAILAALGWERALSSTFRPLRVGTMVLFVGAATSTSLNLLATERAAGEADVDVLVRRWVLAHVRRGARVAIHDENNAMLPRSPQQLHACSMDADGADAYRQKWQRLGMSPPPEGVEPMRSMLMNDEIVYAYWCRRELQVQRDPGFLVVRYHDDLRSNTVLERLAIEEFRGGASTRIGGVDVLIVNRPVAVGRDPVQVVTTSRGARWIYER